MAILAKREPAPNKYVGLQIRILADKSSGKKNPDGSWPVKGFLIENPELPPKMGISTTAVQSYRDKGLITVEGERVVNYPGGTLQDPWKKTHTVHEIDCLVFHTLNGVVRYKVVRQPGKYALSSDTAEESVDFSDPFTIEALKDGAKSVVLWDYRCELES